MNRELRSALVAGLFLVGAAPVEAQSAVKQVLLLQSFDRGILVLDHFTGNLRLGLEESFAKPLNVSQVVVTTTGGAGASEQAVVDYIQALFADRPAPDLIVTVAGPAAVFARRHRQELFPGTPILYGSVDQLWLRDAPLGENESAVAIVNDFPGVVEDILRVLPDTRQVFVVNGSGPIGRFWRRELEPAFARFGERLTFFWSDDLSRADVLRRCASLPRDAAILFLSFGADAQGGVYADEEVLSDLHATASAPLFAGLSPLLGHGIVGGSMIQVGDLGRTTAEVAARILNGEPAGKIRLPPETAGRAVFDWRELQRWGIPESRLPAASDIVYRRPSVWSEHKVAFLAVFGALLLQTALIALLLYERRARHRAEIESRRSLSLAADASRRETMSVLTASIGHELGQPLTALIHNAAALQSLLAANRAAPAEVGEILSDIQSEAALAAQIIDRHRTMLRSRQLQKTPIDVHAVIRESLALVAYDIRARQIETAVDLAPVPGVVDGDQVLLQQVLLNLLKNAMDSLTGTPPAKRRIAIRTAIGLADVELSVSDTGTGLPAEILETLFTPFVTTKAHGLGIGLTIARMIVDAHGGTIEACANPGGGALFTVRLPRTAAPAILAALPSLELSD